MKKTILLAAFFSPSLWAMGQSVMTKQADGTTIINTTTLGKNIIGYQSETPLEIHIKSNAIQKIVALKNGETPKFFARVERLLLPKYVGMSVKKASRVQVDAVSGATKSSKAVQENIKKGIAYYQKNR